MADRSGDTQQAREAALPHEPDYIARTIETVRNHKDADNCWPQWANIFADQIEALDARNAALVAERDRYQTALQHPRRLEDAAMQLALAAEDVNENVMASGLAYRRDRLRDEIGNVKHMIERDREKRRAALAGESE